MNRKAKATFVIISLFLVISIATNVVIFQRSQLYYLQLNGTRLDPLGLNAYSDSPIQTHPPLIIFFGDSRAAEWPPPDQMKSVTFLNRGVGAQTTAQILGRFQAHVVPLNPQVIVIQAGINDLKTIPLFPEQKVEIIQNCKTNIEQIVDLSLATGARVVVTTIFPLGKLPIERRPFWSDDVEISITNVNEFIKTLASDQVTIFESGKVLSNSDGKVNSRYSRDFLHLNPAGYAALNEAISEILVP